MFNFSLRAHYKVLISHFSIYIMQRPLLCRGLRDGWELLSSSCRGNNISENKIKKEADSSLLLIESTATALLNILPFIQAAFSPDCQNSLYSHIQLINNRASPCPLEVADETGRG